MRSTLKKLRYWLRKVVIYTRYQKAQVIFLTILTLLGVYLIWKATDGFTSYGDITLDFGVEILSLVMTYVFFDSILKRVERNRIKEYPELDFPKFIQSIDSAQRTVRILNTWTDFITRHAYQEDFIKAITRAMKRGVVIEFLLLDPRSHAVAMRQKELGTEHNVEQNIRENIQSQPGSAVCLLLDLLTLNQTGLTQAL
jgi:hypothetical protein